MTRRTMLGWMVSAGAGAQEVVFRADSRLVLVGFHAFRDGNSVDDLRADEIVFLEDGEPVPVAVFEGGRHATRTVPMHLLLMFDCSHSVRSSGLLNPKVFDSALLAGYPQVSIGIYGFTHLTRRLAPPTRRIEQLEAAIQEVAEFPPGLTRLYEAVIETIRELAAERAQATRAIVIFSDSMAPADAQPEAIASARRHGVALYPVVLPRNPKDLFAKAGRLNPFERTIPAFVQLGPATGGREFRPKWPHSGVLPYILDEMLAQAVTEYVAGYYAPAERPARARKVEVRLRSPERGQIRGGERIVES